MKNKRGSQSELIDDFFRLTKFDLDNLYRRDQKKVEPEIRCSLGTEPIYRRNKITQLGKQNISEIVRPKMKSFQQKYSRKQKSNIQHTLNMLNLTIKTIEGRYPKVKENIKSSPILVSFVNRKQKESKTFGEKVHSSLRDKKNIHPASKLYDNLLMMKQKFPSPKSNNKIFELRNKIFRLTKVKQFLLNKRKPSRTVELENNLTILSRRITILQQQYPDNERSKQQKFTTKKSIMQVNNQKKWKSISPKHKVKDFQTYPQFQINRWETLIDNHQVQFNEEWDKPTPPTEPQNKKKRRN